MPPPLVHFQKEFNPTPSVPIDSPRPIPWWELTRCSLIAGGVVAVLRWGRDDLQHLGDSLAGLLFSHPFWLIAIAAMMVAIGGRSIPQTFKFVRNWAGGDWIPLLLLSLLVFLIFFFDRGQSPPPCYFVYWTIIWFFLVYLLKWEPRPDSSGPPLDLLNRSYFADRIAELFRSGQTPPHRIAVLGPWGSGKSVLLELLRHRLPEEKNFRIVTVNPWKAKTPDEAWGILASGFDEALRLPSPLPAAWARHPLCSFLAPLLPGIGPEVVKFLASEPSRSRDGLLKKVNDAISRKKAKLLILVDDMERAEAVVLRSLFQVIDQLDEFKGCHFIFAIDGDKVAEAFKEKGRGEFNTRGFMDKVFDLQIPLPEPRQEDVVEMIRAKANEGVTPKLAAALPEFRELIPANPRAAMRFYESAKTKEVLFLNRYGATERNWGAFFTILLVESEFPGFLFEIVRSGVAERFSARSFGLGVLIPEEDRRAAVPEIVEILTPPLHFADDRKQRFTQFIEALINRVDSNDLEWADQGYDKLLELAEEERLKLEKEWITNAGKKPIQDMLDDCLPDLKRAGVRHADPARCARQLLELEVDAIKTKTNSALYPGRRRENELVDLLERVKRLRSHLRFARVESLESDLAFFDESLFGQWLELIAITPSSRARLNGRLWEELQEERAAFHVEMTENFNAFRCSMWATWEMRRTLMRLNERIDPSELGPHCDQLKEAMYRQITPTFATWLRQGEIGKNSPADFPETWDIGRMYQPDVWLWTGSDDWKGALEKLVAEACENPRIAQSCAEILVSLFLYPLTTSTLLDDRTSGWEQISKLSKEYPEYLRFFWDGAMALDDEHETKERVLRYREDALVRQADHPEVITLIETNFPLPINGKPTVAPAS